MRLVDARRLTGPNLLASVPLVVVELELQQRDMLESCVQRYREQLDRMRAALGLGPVARLFVRAHQGGAVLGYEAPVDVMLALTEASEWAAESAARALGGGEPLPLEPTRAELAGQVARGNPALRALLSESASRQVPALWDDTHVSVGQGRCSQTFPIDAIPPVESIAWQSLGRIPVALVTGTNGKTTSTRLLSFVAAEAGLRVGCASTDAILVGGEVVEQGDWTGPAAARTVLRRTDVELAVLETARGGILRRGLAMQECDVALITNVSDDHLGQYGIDDLAAMARVKGVTAHCVRAGGTIVLNAHDPNLVAFASQGLRGDVTWFADRDRGDAQAEAVIATHLRGGGRAILAENGEFRRAEGSSAWALLRLDEVPLTFGGAARHNVENVLGVIGAAWGLGLPEAAMVSGLRGFEAGHNPLRGQLIEQRGVRVLLDFGHNLEGVRALMHLCRGLLAEQSGRLTVVATSAGDRSNREIQNMALAILQANPHRVLVRDLPRYHRGRAPGEVPRVFMDSLLREGMDQGSCAIVDSEVAALRLCFEQAQPGDLVAVMLHVDDREVRDLLSEWK